MEEQAEFVDVVMIPSSSGGQTHQVTVFRGRYKCDCRSFRFRQSCRHLGQAKLYLTLKGLNEGTEARTAV